MQDGGDSTPEGSEESGSIKPEKDSEQVDAGNSPQSEQPEKVYDYYHQHFGVALGAGGQDVRNAEAGSRAAYASTAEVADKRGAKSDSWNALKSLIRYQTSTTKEPEKQDFTSSGDSFEAQWLSKSSDDLPILAETGAGAGAETGAEPEAVRLKWTPIVDNVPEARWSKSEEELEADANAEAAAAEAPKPTPEVAKPVAKKVFGKQSRIGRRQVSRPQSKPDKSYEDALAATARGDLPVAPAVELTGEATIEAKSEDSLNSSSILDDLDALLDSPAEEKVAGSEHEGVSEPEGAEVKSNFGSMNAFARMQKRTKEQVETKEEQSITGDIPDEVQEEVESGNWDTKPAPETGTVEGAAVMNQWCSTSAGDSLPAIPSLDELNSIPTPSVVKDEQPQAKPFSLSTPKPANPEGADVIPDTMRHQASRASWLKAASEYSSSVIKAVTDQMKMLNAKPKKTTPESPEFHTAELPEASEEDSQL
ncbi:hypothetical protein BH10CYA1_BH10CYA1_25870 [soil metagenome]